MEVVDNIIGNSDIVTGFSFSLCLQSKSKSLKQSWSKLKLDIDTDWDDTDNILLVVSDKRFYKQSFYLMKWLGLKRGVYIISLEFYIRRGGCKRTFFAKVMVVQAILDIFLCADHENRIHFSPKWNPTWPLWGPNLSIFDQNCHFWEKGSNLNPRVAKWDSTLAKIEHDFRNQHTKNV